MKTLWIVLISFLATAIVVGGSTYYLMNREATKDKNNLQAQITDLTNKYNDAEQKVASTDTTTTIPAATELTAGWKTYTTPSTKVSFRYPDKYIGEGADGYGVSFIDQSKRNLGISTDTTGRYINPTDQAGNPVSSSNAQKAMLAALEKIYSKRAAEPSDFDAVNRERQMGLTVSGGIKYIETTDSKWRGITYYDGSHNGDLPFALAYDSYLLNIDQNLIFRSYFHFALGEPSEVVELNRATTKSEINANEPKFRALMTKPRSDLSFKAILDEIDLIVKSVSATK
jgi:hypothetical protein